MRRLVDGFMTYQHGSTIAYLFILELEPNSSSGIRKFASFLNAFCSSWNKKLCPIFAAPILPLLAKTFPRGPGTRYNQIQPWTAISSLLQHFIFLARRQSHWTFNDAQVNLISSLNCMPNKLCSSILLTQDLFHRLIYLRGIFQYSMWHLYCIPHQIRAWNSKKEILSFFNRLVSWTRRRWRFHYLSLFWYFWKIFKRLGRWKVIQNLHDPSTLKSSCVTTI